MVYANEYFQRFTGYSAGELLGADLRRLQGDDRDQEGRQKLRRALRSGQAVRALLRNYRKDGTPFLNDVLIEPVHDADGQLTHFLGFHRDAADTGHATEPPVVLPLSIPEVLPLAVPELLPPPPPPAMVATVAGVLPEELTQAARARCRPEPACRAGCARTGSRVCSRTSISRRCCACNGRSASANCAR